MEIKGIIWTRISLGVIKMANAEIIQQMTQRIVDAFSPQKVVVFGSWARGEATADSDVDLLVVMPYSGSKRDCQVSIRHQLRDFDVSKDVLVISPEEYEQKGNTNGYIYQSIVAEGKVLYER